MRRTLAALTATAVLVPLAVTAAPGAASAATNTLTVTAIGRDGVKVKTSVTVTNLGTRARYTLTSGKARTLPRGTYAALANVPTAKDGSSTVGGRIIKVAGASATTIDARKGKPLRVSLSPAPVAGWQFLHARVCPGIDSWGGVDAYGSPGSLYMIPATSQNLRFSYLSHWAEPTASGVQSSFLSSGTAKGIPAGYSKTVKRAGMAKISMNFRSGPSGGKEASIAAVPATQGCAGHLFTGLERQRLPYRMTAHVTPGKWNLTAHSETGSQWTDAQSRDRVYEGGKSYSQTFFRSAWAPAGSPPTVIRKYLDFSTDWMFTDPAFSQGTSSALYHVGGSSQSVVTLTRGGKILKQQKRPNSHGDHGFRYKLTSAGWYNLKADSRRHDPDVSFPAGLLSTRTIAQFHFYADPAKNQLPPVRLIRIVPGGLDLSNSAKPGSVTPVELALLKHGADSDAKPVKMTVKTVAAQASYDGGKTWKKAAVKKSGSGWVANVKNPTSGYVSLRVKVTDTKGNASQITVVRAYRIG